MALITGPDHEPDPSVAALAAHIEATRLYGRTHMPEQEQTDEDAAATEAMNRLGSSVIADTSVRELAEHVMNQRAIVPTEPANVSSEEFARAANNSIDHESGLTMAELNGPIEQLWEAQAEHILETGTRFAHGMEPGAGVLNLLLDAFDADKVEHERALGSLQHRITQLQEERNSIDVARVALLSDLEGHQQTIAALTLDRDSHRAAIATINERLLEEASRRDWCSDFDVFCASVNAYLPANIRIGRPDQRIKVSFEVTVPYGSAERIEGYVDQGLRSNDVPLCSSFGWDIIE